MARDTYLMVADRCREWDEYRAGRPGPAAWSAWWFREYRLSAKQLSRADRLRDKRLGAAWAARYDQMYQNELAEAGENRSAIGAAEERREARFAHQLRYLQQSARSATIVSTTIPLVAVVALIAAAGFFAYVKGKRSRKLRNCNASMKRIGS